MFINYKCRMLFSKSLGKFCFVLVWFGFFFSFILPKNQNHKKLCRQTNKKKLQKSFWLFFRSIILSVVDDTMVIYIHNESFFSPFFRKLTDDDDDYYYEGLLSSSKSIAITIIIIINLGSLYNDDVFSPFCFTRLFFSFDND